MEAFLNYVPKGVQIKVGPPITFNLFNTNFRYNLIPWSCYFPFMFTFSYFIIIDICLHFYFAHLIFLFLVSYVFFWFLCFVFRFKYRCVCFFVHLHNFCAHDTIQKITMVSNVLSFYINEIIIINNQNGIFIHCYGVVDWKHVHVLLTVERLLQDGTIINIKANF